MANGLDDLLRPSHSARDPVAIYPDREAIAFETIDERQHLLVIVLGVADEYFRCSVSSHGQISAERRARNEQRPAQGRLYSLRSENPGEASSSTPGDDGDLLNLASLPADT